ncbi:MAG: DUF2628 domain-containing protein [Ruminococcaceae bacterium]|nr:DUF2628 domain-containing protein [Oscillospiraceae bacterium]
MENMICACCGKEITIDQYRVYCPECKADYHKECWMKNGGCVIDGCKYNRKPVVGICPNCHTPLKKEYAYCTRCGRPTNPLMNLVTYPNGSRFYVPNTEAECAEKLIGEKSDEFMKDFYEMEVKKLKPSWSFPAFLFNGFWYIYRKMYKQGIALLLFVALLINSITFFPEHRFLSIPVTVLLFIASGIFGNGIYMRHIKNVARGALEAPANLRMDYIHKHGETDKKGLAIAIAVCAVLLAAFVFLAKSVI